MAKKSEDVAALSTFLVVRGIAAILFGILALAWPGLTFKTLTLFIMLWLVVSGVVLIIQAFMNLRDGWVTIGRLLLGVFQVGVGAYLVQRPELALSTLVVLIALVLIVEGVMNVVSAFMDDMSTSGKTAWVISGLLYILAGIVIWQYPVQGTLAFVWVLGLSALVGGALSIAAASDVRKMAQ